MKHALDGGILEPHDLDVVHGRSCGEPTRLPGETTFAKEIPFFMYGDDRFLASLRNHRDFAITMMDVADAVAAIPLGEDGFAPPVFYEGFSPIYRCKKGLKVEVFLALGHHG